MKVHATVTLNLASSLSAQCTSRGQWSQVTLLQTHEMIFSYRGNVLEPLSGRHDFALARHRQNVSARRHSLVVALCDRESALSRCDATRTSRTRATRPTIGTVTTAARNHTLPPLEDHHDLRSSANLDDDETGLIHSSAGDSSATATIHSCHSSYQQFLLQNSLNTR